MSDFSLDLLKTNKGLVAAALAMLGVAMLIGALFSGGRATVEPSYPYWCKDCGEVFDITELNADQAAKWRIPDDAPSDSIALCLRCDTGWAYPAPACKTCGTHHVIGIDGDGRCPVCNPEVAAAAKESGVTLIPDKLK